MKAFAYIRVSSKIQCEGDGPDRQREKIAAFCKSNGLEYAGDWFEQGVSGTVEGLDRPEFMQLLRTIDTMTHEHRLAPPVIVVERMDRLARDLMVQELLLSECKKRSVKVYAADQGVLMDVANDEGDPTRKLIRQIMGAIAEWEKNVIVMKLRAGRDKKKRETGRCEGPKPYGQNEDELKVLTYIDKLVKESLPFRHIAGSLNLSGIKTRSGKPWNKSRVFHVYNQWKNKCEDIT